MANHCASFLALVLLPGACSQGFLASRKIAVSSVRSELRDALSEVLGVGHGISGKRMANIRGALTPLFRSLPKTPHGRLSAAVVRYAVQRYFRQQHGWMMKGFEPHAPVANASDWASGAQILEGKVPDFVRAALEEKLSHDGFALEDAVLMIAVLERLILDEVIAGVETAFDLNELDATQPLSLGLAAEVLSSYLINEMLQGGTKNITLHKRKKANIQRIYPHWHEAIKFLSDVRLNDLYEHRHRFNPFSESDIRFEDVVRISQRLAEQFGPFSNHECETMKSALISMDTAETGRVKISDLYNRNKGGAWQFEEGFEYLRQSGAIDSSSEVLGAHVIIPNYLASVSNCIVSKEFHSICCLNECDSVYQHLEAAIPNSYGSASEVAAVVEGMALPGRDFKNLSTALRTRLDEVASLHDGKVPLHGRLIAQWLHFVFPRDCPYPHMVGSTNPQSQNDYEALHGPGSSEISSDEVELFLKSESASIAPSPEAGLLMWNFQEVLLDTTTLSATDREAITLRTLLRIFALLGMLGWVAVLGFKEALRIVHALRPEVKAVQYVV